MITRHQLRFAALLHRDGILAYDGKTRPASANRLTPEFFRRLGAPVGRQSRTRQHSVPFGAVYLGIVLRRCSRLTPFSNLDFTFFVRERRSAFPTPSDYGHKISCHTTNLE